MFPHGNHMRTRSQSPFEILKSCGSFWFHLLRFVDIRLSDFCRHSLQWRRKNIWLCASVCFQVQLISAEENPKYSPLGRLSNCGGFFFIFFVLGNCFVVNSSQPQCFQLKSKLSKCLDATYGEWESVLIRLNWSFNAGLFSWRVGLPRPCSVQCVLLQVCSSALWIINPPAGHSDSVFWWQRELTLGVSCCLLPVWYLGQWVTALAWRECSLQASVDRTLLLFMLPWFVSLVLYCHMCTLVSLSCFSPWSVGSCECRQDINSFSR